jgi:hypothetical protein
MLVSLYLLYYFYWFLYTFQDNYNYEVGIGSYFGVSTSSSGDDTIVVFYSDLIDFPDSYLGVISGVADPHYSTSIRAGGFIYCKSKIYLKIYGRGSSGSSIRALGYRRIGTNT